MFSQLYRILLAPPDGNAYFGMILQPSRDKREMADICMPLNTDMFLLMKMLYRAPARLLWSGQFFTKQDYETGFPEGITKPYPGDIWMGQKKLVHFHDLCPEPDKITSKEMMTWYQKHPYLVNHDIGAYCNIDITEYNILAMLPLLMSRSYGRGSNELSSLANLAGVWGFHLVSIESEKPDLPQVTLGLGGIRII